MNEADAAAYGRYMNMASDGSFDMLLGRRAEQIIAKAYLDPGHDFSYEYVVFAEIAGATVGAASGYTAAQHAASSDKPLLVAAGWSAPRLILMYALGRNLVRFMDNVPDGDFYVHAAGVDEAHRGRGVGTFLLDHLEDKARKAGCRRLVLDVSETNTGAKALYERRRMQVEAQSKPIMGASGSTVYRMVKEL